MSAMPFSEWRKGHFLKMINPAFRNPRTFLMAKLTGEERILSFIYAHPLSGRTNTVTRIVGKEVPGRVFSSEEDVRELASLLSSHICANPSSELHLNIIPAKTEKYGIYIDVDAMLRSSEPISDMIARAPNVRLLSIVSEFVKLYVANLVKAHLAYKGVTPVDMGREFPFSALYAPRPRLEPKGKEGDVFQYKHGCHLYIGEIQASQNEHCIAFDLTRQLIASPAYDGSKLVREMMEAYDMPREEVARSFDANINTAMSVLLPGCRKAGGHVTYRPSDVINFRLIINDGHPAVTFERTVPYMMEIGLRRFFPIHPGREAFVIETEFDARTIKMTDLPEPSKEDLDKMDVESLIGEMKKRGNESILNLTELLLILPFDKIADSDAGHSYRLNIVNATVHGISVEQESERKEWASRIVHLIFNRGIVPKGVEWNLLPHINEKVEEALISGRRVGIAWVKKEASLVDADAVRKHEEFYKACSIKSFLRLCYTRHKGMGGRRTSAINHQEAASFFFMVLGHDYRTFPGSGQKDRIWYHYTDDATPHFASKKWYRCGDIKMEIMSDIKRRINPLLDKIAREPEEVASIVASSTTFPQFLSEVRDTLGNANFIGNMIDFLASEYVERRVGADFASSLDMVDDLTGCLNGILRFEHHPFKVTLLDGDNREFPVSRSLNACYRTDFTDDSPAVKRIYSIFTTVIPNRAELDYLLTCAAGIILSGRRFEKFFILYGCGGDGKTTIMNALISLAGRNVSGRYPGYGAEGDPRIFQYEKKDANSHDGGSYHLYGGPRIGNFPEPSSEHPFLVESAIKSKLSGSAQPTRDLHQSSQTLEWRIVPFLLTNDQLEFIGTITVGGQRRTVCALFTEKFKPIEEMRLFRNKPNVHEIDPTAIKAFEYEAGREMREALLWILITKYLPQFYDRYNASIDNIPLPRRYKEVTASFFGRHADVMVSFMSDKMAPIPAADAVTTATVTAASAPSATTTPPSTDRGIINLTEFMNVFTIWYRTTQRGMIGELKGMRSRRMAAGRTEQVDGPVSRDPWTHEILHILSSSPLGTDIFEREGDTLTHLGPNEISLRNVSRLVIQGWAWKTAATATTTATPSAASTSATATPPASTPSASASTTSIPSTASTPSSSPSVALSPEEARILDTVK
ncbi:MAG: hypothetical protein WC483_03325 [Candidatus Paceibacterota bacterium]